MDLCFALYYRAKNVTGVAPQEKRKKHRLKLLKKIQENRMRSKAMINHVPTDQVTPIFGCTVSFVPVIDT
jgi:hypothetical protein